MTEKKMELSNRMRAVAELVPCGHTAADVGCDHGFVSIYLAQHDICPRVFAGDVRKGPLERAKEHIRESRLSGRITAVLSDGLKNIPVAGGREQGEKCGADGFIAAGMGGRLIVQILTDVPEKTGALKWCVLSPQSEIWLVRQKLEELGFLILRETMVLEDGKYYPMMLAVREEETEWSSEAAAVREKNNALSERMLAAGFTQEERRRAADWLGSRLIGDRNAVLISFLEHIIAADGLLLSGMPQAGAPEEEKEAAENAAFAAKQERIARRRREIERRRELSGKVLKFLKEE